MALALRLVGGAAGVGAKAVGGACCGIVDSCFRHMTKGMPHPTECGCLGSLFFYLGLHDHQKFNLLVEIHELDRVPKSSSLFVTVEAGRWSTTSQVVKTKGQNQRVILEERLMVHIRQVDKEMKLSLFKKGMLKTTRLANLVLKVKEDMIDKKFPQRTWYPMKVENGKSNPRINLSLHRMDANLPTNQSPLVQQAMLIAQQEADEKGEELKLDLSKMSQKERLTFFSRVLEGPLEWLSRGRNACMEFYYKAVEVKPGVLDRFTASQGTWTELYFKAVEVKTDRWEWCYWESAAACKEGKEKEGSIPFLAISLVLPDRKDRNVFYVRYHDKDTQHDVFFRRVDRDRNLWSDGLYEFIEKLRAYRETCSTRVPDRKGRERQEKKKGREGEGDEEGAPCAKSPRKSGRKSRRPSASTTPRVDLSTARRLHSPRAQIPTKGPNAHQQMYEEVMLSTQSSVVGDDEPQT
ncbi:hypothetical protein NCLIV_057920 [Neospora caninum Liverpool]|uniref:CERLI1-like PH domain-containing protein n=1 Tax=Neospora caninum (strain Liverpool) TaxID=572307 RepID=F0VNS3_NEOCL|nr:hypothetical protein NCLIV_057920 [Neospora caninum Liverpool]CBZ55369.1 hypothetical protein NCLIV_057920 [Neospora caninum Liverpool]CEL70105.1 TPA: hypothetical protein BN1204_057920 [Neospora caninum Liverpool]|eukprot:XP_003885397.1 hypothetical protein NCLIV_057920 [Neospora caninum Liverpool]